MGKENRGLKNFRSLFRKQKKPKSPKRPRNKKAEAGNETYKFNILRLLLNVLKLVIAFFIILGLAASGLVAGTVYGYVKTTPPLDASLLKYDSVNSYVYDAEENIIAELKRNENRVLIDIDEVPKNLVHAFIAIEDKRFYNHDGVDFEGFARAMRTNLQRMASGNFSSFEGASTITMQLVKNLTGNDEVTPKRKIQEMVQAIQLQKQGLTKEEILYHYLNNVPLGGNFYGIETAAQGFFGKNVRDLSLAECASLAGITQWPTRYMPISEKNIQANLSRMKDVLDIMLEEEMISQKEYDQAMEEDIDFQYNPQAGKVTKTSNQSYFVDEAILSVKNDLMQTYGYTEQTALDIIYNSGVKIYTSMQPNVQKALDEVYIDEADKWFTDANPTTDELPQSAMVIIDQQTGYIAGIYGGRGEKEGSVFNRATQGRRQPGSGIKPVLVYAPGIEERSITTATIVDDIPQYMNNQKPEEIYPRNYGYENYGLTTVREGLVNSRNVVAALLLRDFVGIDTGLDYLSKVGIDRKDERYISIAMGGFNKGMTPLEMAGAYTALANRGVYSKPLFYTRVLNKNDEVMLENKPQSTIVYSEKTAFIMNNMMQEVVTRGTAAGYGIKNAAGQTIPTAGKTGTTSDWKDKWFYGYSPYYLGVTWYGYDDYRISLRYSNSDEESKALEIWNSVMTKVHADSQPKDFYTSPPANIVKREICIDSGKLATDLCHQDPRGDRVRTEYFIKGTEPQYTDVCDVHRKAVICTSVKDNLGRPFLATPQCPPETTKEIVYIHRPVEYKSQQPNEPIPLDVKYEIAEGEYCTEHGLFNANGTLVQTTGTEIRPPD